MSKSLIILGLVFIVSPAFAETCYDSYAAGLRSDSAQYDPKRIIEDYHHCMAEEKTADAQATAQAQYRAERASSGHNGGRTNEESHSSSRVSSSHTTSSRGTLITSQDLPLSPARQAAEAVKTGACPSFSRSYFGPKGQLVCGESGSVVAERALAKANEVKISQMRGLLAEISQTHPVR